MLITLFFWHFQGTLVNENDSASRLRGPSRAMSDARMKVLGNEEKPPVRKTRASSALKK